MPLTMGIIIKGVTGTMTHVIGQQEKRSVSSWPLLSFDSIGQYTLCVHVVFVSAQESNVEINICGIDYVIVSGINLDVVQCQHH